MRSKQADCGIEAVAHIGIRVQQLERSLTFYEKFGFERTAGPFEGEPVVILKHPSGVEINLIVNAKPDLAASNILMDVETKHAGYTHIALQVRTIEEALAFLSAHGIAVSGGPVDFPNGTRGVFIRDPDRNVIELHQPATNH